MNKNKKDLEERTKKLKNRINIKFIFYFITGFIILLFCFYYLSMFCAIYRNTQNHLIKDTLISYILSFISPFWNYLIPGLFRIPALSNRKKQRIWLYRISLIIQMF